MLVPENLRIYSNNFNRNSISVSYQSSPTYLVHNFLEEFQSDDAFSRHSIELTDKFFHTTWIWKYLLLGDIFLSSLWNGKFRCSRSSLSRYSLHTYVSNTHYHRFNGSIIQRDSTFSNNSHSIYQMVYSYSRTLFTLCCTCLSISSLDCSRTLSIFFRTNFALSIEDIDNYTTFTSYWSTRKIIQIFFTDASRLLFDKFIDDWTDLSNTTDSYVFDHYYGLNYSSSVRAFFAYDNEVIEQFSQWIVVMTSIDWRMKSLLVEIIEYSFNHNISFSFEIKSLDYSLEIQRTYSMKYSLIHYRLIISMSIYPYL